jgi:hypothetical protein
VNYNDIIRIPYTTLPNFEKYRGPLFHPTPSPAHMAAKRAMFDDDKIYGRSWFETQIAKNNNLPNKAAEILHLTTRSDSIKDLALLLQEDVAILYEGKLEACCFMFPSGWAPETKQGMSFAELHRPVADGERLRASGEIITKTMCGEHSYHRSVWGLAASNMLSAHPRYRDRIVLPQSLADIWFRYEHQITVPIERGLTSLFLVDVQLVPFMDLSEQHRARVKDSIASMSDAVSVYKNMDMFKPALELV